MTKMISAVAAFRMENDKELISKHRFVFAENSQVGVCIEKSGQCFEYQYTFLIASKKSGP